MLALHAALSMIDSASASRMKNPKNISSSENTTDVAAVQISEQARAILNTLSKQTLSESIDNAWERIKDNEITRAIIKRCVKI
jgi:hypothetical protein